jgi:hypothetical protein
MLKGNSNKKVGFRLDFLSEFEAIFETALAHESGPYRGDCLMTKTEGRKSHDTVPLRYSFSCLWCPSSTKGGLSYV